MPLFEYTTIQSNGKKVKRTLSADCLETAKEQLRKQQVLVTNVTLLSKRNVKLKLAPNEKLNFTRQLAQLLRSGLALYDSLVIIEEKFEGHKNHFFYVDLCDLVKRGTSLSKALSLYGNSFNSIYLAMVSAAEESGCLAEAFEELAIIIEKEQRIKKKVQSAMIYPCFLLFFCFVVVLSMFLFLIPSMKELFEGKKLHPLTQSVISLSDFLNAYFPFVIIGFLFISISAFLGLRSQKGKRFIETISLKIPLVKTLVTYAIMVRFSKSMGALLKSGVSLIYALKLSKDVMNHHQFEAVIEKAEQHIMKGGRFSEECLKHKVIPPLIGKMLATAEESGFVEEMFEHIAKVYQEDLEKTIEQFIQMIQPMMILFLGVIVGFVILSIMLPLTDVSSFLN